MSEKIAIAVRRILMISPKSSLHAHKAVLVFARARMCGHLSLVAPPNAHRETIDFFSTISQPPRNGHLLVGGFSFPLFPSHREIGLASFKQAAFPLLLMQFYQSADMTRFMMTFGLVGIRTPFNLRKS